MSEVELTEALTRANSQLQSLQARVNELEKKTSANVVLPSTDLLSDRFLKRAFAVLGHYIVASLIIALPIYALLFIIFLIVGVSFQ